MKKMAVFVEGYTESIFVDRLISEIATRNTVLVEHRKIRGGSTCRVTYRLAKAAGTAAGHSHFVMIYDCAGGEPVKARMVAQYESLTKAAYSRIVCLRDVFPHFSFAEIPLLEAALPRFVKTSPVVVDFILSVMELEAWFLAEYTHFARVDDSITIERIKNELGFDPAIDDLQLRPSPAADLDACYQLGGKQYLKHQSEANVGHLDFAQIYLSVTTRFNYLASLVRVIEEFLRS